MNETDHKPLNKSRSVLAWHVANAFERLVEEREEKLPLTITRQTMVDKLVEMATTDEDGLRIPVPPMFRDYTAERIANRLANSAVFQSGYKRYEKRSGHTVIPVTDFFFQNICAPNEGGTSSDVGEIEQMSEFEVLQSLPSRWRHARDADNNVVIDAAGSKILVEGIIAGVVILPPNTNSKLVEVWLHRQQRSTDGSMEKQQARIEHAHPGRRVAIEKVEQHRIGFKSAAREATKRRTTE